MISIRARFISRAGNFMGSGAFFRAG